MPELPEVETVRRELAPAVAGATVTAAAVGRAHRRVDAVETLVGRTIGGLERRGKWLLGPLDDGRTLVVHLGMTGQLQFGAQEQAAVTLTLDEAQTVSFTDVRTLGRFTVATDPAAELPGLRDLGPEPFSEEFTATGLHAAVARSRQMLKAQLLSQKPVAGLGNIYVDEALWLSRLHPQQRGVKVGQASRLHEAVRVVLAGALAGGGTTLSDYRRADGSPGGFARRLRCYGRAGQLCARCGATLVKLTVAGRGTTCCPRCQPGD